MEDGLSQRFVLEVVVDCKGFLWVATEDGLNKYDGYSFKHFRNDPDDSTSLGGNILRQALESHAYGGHKLYVCTVGGGLACLDLTTELFTNYQHDPEDSTSISNNSVWIVEETLFDGVPEIWVGVIGPSLDRLNIRTGKFKRYKMPSMVTDLFYDSHGILWVGTSSAGIGRYNPDTDDFTFYQHDPNDPASLASRGTYDMTEDQFGNLWIGTIGPLDRMILPDNEQASPVFEHWDNDPDDPDSFSGPSVEYLFEDSKGRLWVSTFGGGQDLFDREQKTFTHFKHDPDNPHSVGANSIFSIAEDHSGVIWFGHQNGISKWDDQKAPYTRYEYSRSGPTGLKDLWISAILSTLEKNQQILWLGTIGKGLCRYNRSTGEAKWYRHDKNKKNSIADNNVLSMVHMDSNELLIVTWGGASRFNTQTEEFETYYFKPDANSDYSEEVMMASHRGPSGRIWVTTMNHIAEFNRDRNRLENVANVRAYAVLEAENNGKQYLWGGSFNYGLLRINLETKKRTWYLNDPLDDSSISNNMIEALFQSKLHGKDVLWVGTMSGLDRYDYETQTFKHYGVSDGLPHNHITCINEDRNGDLWITSKLGLTRFDPINESFKTFWKEDGLPSDAYEFESIHRSEGGEIFVGGDRGLVSFFPDSIRENPVPPNVVLTDFKIFHESVPIGPADKDLEPDKFSLNKHISYTDSISLSHEDNVITVTYSALDFRSPMKNRYAYKLEPFDKGWIYTDANRREATYTNLPPGAYTFRVKGSNNDGVWNEKGTSLKIIIAPPWWNTYEARVLYLLLLASIGTLLYRSRISRLRIQHQAQLDHLEAEKYHELDDLKSRFFANISHEFRTPLTLILGPVKKLLTKHSSEEDRKSLMLIQRQSKRLLNLVTQLLDLTRLEQSHVRLQTSQRNIIPLLKALVLSFSSLAERREISLTFNTDLEDIQVYVEKESMVKIMNNLLSNAFRFSTSGDQIQVLVSVNEKSDHDSEGEIQIDVVDTGRGVSPEDQEHIFDRFYQSKQTRESAKASTGIGLALTKELVELHKGQIFFESCEGIGSTFTIRLPLGSIHLSSEEIIETADDEDTLAIDTETLEVSEPEQVQIASGSILPRILIVEDNPDVRNYIRSYLNKEFRCYEAENGMVGLELIAKQHFELVISDIMMPGMNGVEFCETIKSDANTSHIPVILLTARADLKSKLEGLETGADDYLTKPFDAEELVQRVKNLVEQRQSLRERFQREIALIPDELELSSIDTQFVENAIRIVSENMEDTKFSVNTFSRQIHMSRQHLNRKLKSVTGMSTLEFIRSQRLKRAAVLLKNEEATVTEIAFQVGFSSPSHFSRSFQKEFGVTPSKYLADH